MRIAVVGAGDIGRHVGRLLARSGHEIVVSWSSSPERLRRAADWIGDGARHDDDPGTAVGMSDAVLFAPRFEHVAAASAAVGGFGGRVVVDTTNPYNPERDGLVDLGGQNAAAYVRDRLDDARYFKGFNTLTAEFLTESAGRTGVDRVVVFLSGDDELAVSLAAGLVRDAGFDPVSLGSVADSARQLPGGRLYGEQFHLSDLSGLRSA